MDATPPVLFVLPPDGCDLVLLMHKIRNELHPRLRRIVFGGVAAAPHLFVEVEESLDEASSLALAAAVETLSTGLRCSIARAPQIKRLPPRNRDIVGAPSNAVSISFHEAFPRDKAQNLLQYYHGVDFQKSDHKIAVFSDALCASMAFEDLRSSTNLDISYIQSSNDSISEVGGEPLGITALQIKQLPRSEDFEMISALREKSLWGRIGVAASLLNLLAGFNGFSNLIYAERRNEATAIFDESSRAQLAFDRISFGDARGLFTRKVHSAHLKSVSVSVRKTLCFAEFSTVDKAKEVLEDLRSLTNLCVEFVDRLTGKIASKQPAQASIYSAQPQHQESCMDLSALIKEKAVLGKAAKKKKRHSGDGNQKEIEMQVKEVSSDGVVTAELKSLEQSADEKVRRNSAKKSSEESKEDKALGSTSRVDQKKGSSDDHNENSAPSEQSSRNKNKPRKPAGGKKGKGVDEKTSPHETTSNATGIQSPPRDKSVSDEFRENTRALAEFTPNRTIKRYVPTVVRKSVSSSSLSTSESVQGQSGMTPKVVHEVLAENEASDKAKLASAYGPEPVVRHNGDVHAPIRDRDVMTGSKDAKLEGPPVTDCGSASPSDGNLDDNPTEVSGDILHQRGKTTHQLSKGSKPSNLNSSKSETDATAKNAPATSKATQERRMVSSKHSPQFLRVPRTVASGSKVSLKHIDVVAAAKLCCGYEDCVETKISTHLKFDSPESGKIAKDELETKLGAFIYLARAVDYELHAEEASQKTERRHLAASPSEASQNPSLETPPESAEKTSESGPLVTSAAAPSQKVTDVLLIKLDKGPQKFQYGRVTEAAKLCQGFMNVFEAKKLCFIVFDSKDTAKHARTRLVKTLKLVVDYSDLGAMAHAMTAQKAHPYPRSSNQRMDSPRSESAYQSVGSFSDDGRVTATFSPPSFSQNSSEFNGNNAFYSHSPGRGRGFGRPMSQYSRGGSYHAGEPRPYLGNRNSAPTLRDQYQNQRTCWNLTNPSLEPYNALEKNKLSLGFAKSGLLEGGPDDEDGEDVAVNFSPSYQEGRGSGRVGRGTGRSFFGEQQRRNPCDERPASGSAELQNRYPRQMNGPHPPRTMENTPASPDDEWGSSASSQVTLPQFPSGQQANLQPRSRPELTAAVDIPDDEWKDEAQQSSERSHRPRTKTWISDGGRTGQKMSSQEGKPASLSSPHISAPVNEWGQEGSSTVAFSTRRDQSHPQSLPHREKHLHPLDSHSSASPDNRERSASANMRRDFGSYTEQPKHGSYQHSSFYQQNQNVRYHPNSPQKQNTQSQPPYSVGTSQHQKKENQLHNGMSNYGSSYRGPTNTSPGSGGSEKRQVVRASAPKMGSPGDRVHDSEGGKLPPNEYGGGFSRN
ncbi:hypothetical protein HDU81_005717 [Chytriomyces hyalinus]|nr:hypothetical protein HDU81_005717 [Chytriomyces hyalinus]